MLTTIHLHGRIGKMFGRMWRFDVSQVSEALTCIARARKDFFEYMMNAEKNGVVFRVIDNKGRALSCAEELAITNTNELHLYPIVVGSKRQGLVQTIVGVVLIIIGALLMIYSPEKASGTKFMEMGWMYITGYIAVSVGISLTLGGILQMLTPLPKIDAKDKGVGNSNLFDGSNMASRQGIAIPVGYGKMHLAGMLVSASLYSDQTASQYAVPDLSDEYADWEQIPDYARPVGGTGTSNNYLYDVYKHWKDTSERKDYWGDGDGPIGTNWPETVG